MKKIAFLLLLAIVVCSCNNNRNNQASKSMNLVEITSEIRSRLPIDCGMGLYWTNIDYNQSLNILEHEYTYQISSDAIDEYSQQLVANMKSNSHQFALQLLAVLNHPIDITSESNCSIRMIYRFVDGEVILDEIYPVSEYLPLLKKYQNNLQRNPLGLMADSWNVLCPFQLDEYTTWMKTLYKSENKELILYYEFSDELIQLLKNIDKKSFLQKYLYEILYMNAGVKYEQLKQSQDLNLRNCTFLAIGLDENDKELVKVYLDSSYNYAPYIVVDKNTKIDHITFLIDKVNGKSPFLLSDFILFKKLDFKESTNEIIFNFQIANQFCLDESDFQESVLPIIYQYLNEFIKSPFTITYFDLDNRRYTIKCVAEDGTQVYTDTLTI